MYQSDMKKKNVGQKVVISNYYAICIAWMILYILRKINGEISKQTFLNDKERDLLILQFTVVVSSTFVILYF